MGYQKPNPSRAPSQALYMGSKESVYHPHQGPSKHSHNQFEFEPGRTEEAETTRIQQNVQGKEQRAAQWIHEAVHERVQRNSQGRCLALCASFSTEKLGEGTVSMTFMSNCRGFLSDLSLRSYQSVFEFFMLVLASRHQPHCSPTSVCN